MSEGNGTYVETGPILSGSPFNSALEHLDGVPWYEAPPPRRRHHCWTQTRAFLNGEWVFRCACGAIAIHTPPELKHEPIYWMERNRRASAESEVAQSPTVAGRLRWWHRKAAR